MKAECILPSSFDELQETLNKMGISIQQFFLDERIDPKQRQDILTAALGENGAKNFTEVANAKIEKYLAAKAKKELERENIKENIVEDVVLNRIRRLQGKLSPEYEGMYLEKLVQDELKLTVSQKQSEALVEAQASIDASLESLNRSIAEAKDSKGEPLFKAKAYKDIYKNEDIEKIHKDPALHAKYLQLGLAIRKYNLLHGEIQQQVLEQGAGAVFKKIVGSTRSAILSADLSFGRNIGNMLFVSPKTFWKSWWNGVTRTLTDVIYGTSKDKHGYTKQDYAWAEMYAHPNVVSGRLKQLGVNIGITEEQFLESYWAKGTEQVEEYSRKGESAVGRKLAQAARPIARLYSASESGFTTAVNMARFTYANTMIEAYNANTKADIKILKEAGVGDLIMEQTGRLNGLNDKKWVDRLSFVMMAMRWTGSRISTATNIWRAGATIADLATRGKVKSLEGKYLNKTNVDKGRSALGLVIGMPLIAAAISAALDENEDLDYWDKFLKSFDPVSGDYGKIVFGKTRFDVTFGVASVISTVAKTIDLMITKQYGKDSWDPVARFLRNRQAPVLSIMSGAVEHVWAGLDETHLPTDIMGEPETITEYARGVLLPIYVDNIISAFGKDKDPEVSAMEATLGIVSDFIGISASTYSSRKSKADILEEWGAASPLAKIGNRSNLATKLSKEEFKQAQEEMRDIYLDEASRLMNSAVFQSLSKEEKDKELQKLHRRVTDHLSVLHGVSAKPKKKNKLKQ